MVVLDVELLQAAKKKIIVAKKKTFFIDFFLFKCKSQAAYLIIFLNKPSLPLNGGYFIDGSNHVGVFITAFR